MLSVKTYYPLFSIAELPNFDLSAARRRLMPPRPGTHGSPGSSRDPSRPIATTSRNSQRLAATACFEPSVARCTSTEQCATPPSLGRKAKPRRRWSPHVRALIAKVFAEEIQARSVLMSEVVQKVKSNRKLLKTVTEAFGQDQAAWKACIKDTVRSFWRRSDINRNGKELY